MTFEELEDWEGLNFDLGGYFGYLSAQDYAGDQSAPSWGNGYVYGGVTGDLVYNFNENVSASAGVRWSANNDGSTGYAGGDMGPQENLWFGTSLGFAY